MFNGEEDKFISSMMKGSMTVDKYLSSVASGKSALERGYSKVMRIATGEPA